MVEEKDKAGIKSLKLRVISYALKKSYHIRKSIKAYILECNGAVPEFLSK
ncbi:MAG: hypothetical protein PVH61_35590 [Candidatus Aminicenantes bacterium]|jgi:hypothetical protein